MSTVSPPPTTTVSAPTAAAPTTTTTTTAAPTAAATTAANPGDGESNRHDHYQQATNSTSSSSSNTNTTTTKKKNGTSPCMVDESERAVQETQRYIRQVQVALKATRKLTQQQQQQQQVAVVVSDSVTAAAADAFEEDEETTSSAIVLPVTTTTTTTTTTGTTNTTGSSTNIIMTNNNDDDCSSSTSSSIDDLHQSNNEQPRRPDGGKRIRNSSEIAVDDTTTATTTTATTTTTTTTRQKDMAMSNDTTTAAAAAATTTTTTTIITTDRLDANNDDGTDNERDEESMTMATANASFIAPLREPLRIESQAGLCCCSADGGGSASSSSSASSSAGSSASSIALDGACHTMERQEAIVSEPSSTIQSVPVDDDRALQRTRGSLKIMNQTVITHTGTTSHWDSSSDALPDDYKNDDGYGGGGGARLTTAAATATTTTTTATATRTPIRQERGRARENTMKRSSSFKGMWKGLKKRMGVISAVKGSKTSHSPVRNTAAFSNSGTTTSSGGANHTTTTPSFPSFRAPLRRCKTTDDQSSSTQPLPPKNITNSERKRPEAPSNSLNRSFSEAHLTISRSSKPPPQLDLRGSTSAGSKAVQDITEADLAELEQIAKVFKDGLQTMSYFDRRKQKKYQKCFCGSAAVDFLCQYTQTRRTDAAKIGRELVYHFALFIPVSKKMNSMDGIPKTQHESVLLQDSGAVVYRFLAFLPSEVQTMNLEAKAYHFEEGVSVRNRRSGLKQYKNCFVGADAITYLVKSRLVKTRADGMQLAKRFIVEFNLFESVNRVTEFLDSRYKYYQFVEKKNRYFSIHNILSTRLIQMGEMVSEDSDGHDDESDRSYDSNIDDDDDDDKNKSDGGGPRDTDNIVADDYQKLIEVADVLERGIKVSDNSKKARGGSSRDLYRNTFVGARAVTFMVTAGLAETRSQAEKLGRRLEVEFNLFKEVTGKKHFGDNNYYFTFTDKAARITKPMKAEKPLPEIAAVFEQSVKVRDNTYRLKTYKNTFVGSKAVDFLVNSRLAQSREEAVRIGSQLVFNFNLFEPVTGSREFSDDTQFFRFTPLSMRKDPNDKSENTRKVSTGPMLLQDYSFRSRARLLSKDISEEHMDLAETFMLGVKVKENKYRARAYPRTFVGSDAVSFMVNSSLAKSRKHAVDLGRTLSKEVGLFLGINGSKDFKDDYLLYRFSEQFGDDISKNMQSVSHKFMPLDKIAESFRKGVTVSDHKDLKLSGMKTKRKRFVGSEAVDFLVGAGFADNRVEAVGLGRALFQEFELFEHEKKDREFEDEDFLYRFCYEGPIRPLEVIEMDISRLMDIAKDFEVCVKTKTNKLRLRRYVNTFVGSDAVDYLVDATVASSRKEAVQIGRALNKEFNLFEHVTNDRKFGDTSDLYFFVKDNERYKGLNLEKKKAKRNIFDSTSEEFDNSNGSDFDMKGSLQNLGQINFEFETEETEWAEKLKTFETKMRSKQLPSTRHFMMQEDDDCSVATSVLKMTEMQEKFKNWSSKFRRLDPRYQIEYFFDFVAQDGAKGVEAQVMEVDNLRPLLNFLPNRANVFTVWRPTSLDAIRKMMLGEAVGKGLDIKGKSAKRGKLSGFVPFLQIGENKHKSKIRPPSRDSLVRVYYPGHARRGRDIAAEKLERVALEMIQTVESAKNALGDSSISKAARKDALDAMLLDLGPDPAITYLDDCAPSRYGLEIPERLFWEAYFVRQDCTRKPGSEYDTGRPSQPAFQDMNFAAIRAEPKKDAPRAVVYQNADSDSPMNPFELLIAYEEDGRVMPVVSDFDCFLVGTKRVGFTTPMAKDQMKVLKWYVDEIENVMKNSKVGESWTVTWLEVLKKAAREGFYPEMPRFGFGDPKSYSIMKNAVSRLSHSGAVRHGAECFNYYFPQDLDDEFLVVANDLPNNKPWAYVDVEGLQDILEDRIDKGYTFPLNPKWVLCDSYRWKELYDKLLLSNKKETQQSMNIWFPPESGLREQIERVHERRPNGFYNEGPGAPVDSDDSSNEGGVGGVGGGSLAKDMMSTVVALRLLEKFQARTKKFQAAAEDDDSV